MTGDQPWPQADPLLRCPCLTGLPYGECCAPLHDGAVAAPTAERLMRSRYAAFVFGDEGYLERSWHPATRPRSLDLDPETRWFRLEIIDTAGGGASDARGEVEFVARFRTDGVAGEVHENSTFVRSGGTWVYLDGVQLPPATPR